MGNHYRTTERFFRKYELIIADLIKHTEGEVIQLETMDGTRYRGSTIAVNLGFAIKSCLGNRWHTNAFDINALNKWHSTFTVIEDTHDRFNIIVRKRARPLDHSEIQVRRPSALSSREEAARVARLSHDIGDMDLFRSVLRCMLSNIIAVPVPLKGEYTDRHQQILSDDYNNCADLVFIDGATLIMPNVSH